MAVREEKDAGIFLFIIDHVLPARQRELVCIIKISRKTETILSGIIMHCSANFPMWTPRQPTKSQPDPQEAAETKPKEPVTQK